MSAARRLGPAVHASTHGAKPLVRSTPESSRPRIEWRAPPGRYHIGAPVGRPRGNTRCPCRHQLAGARQPVARQEPFASNICVLRRLAPHSRCARVAHGCSSGAEPVCAACMGTACRAARRAPCMACAARGVAGTPRAAVALGAPNRIRRAGKGIRGGGRTDLGMCRGVSLGCTGCASQVARPSEGRHQHQCCLLP